MQEKRTGGLSGSYQGSLIDQGTIHAYLETEYHIEDDPRFCLRIGIASQALQRVYARVTADRGAFITACNPLSRRLDDVANERLHRQLIGELRAAGIEFIPGIGQHPDNGWPGEPGCLVFGLARPDAEALGRKYEQNAIVWCGPDAVPELVLLR